MRVALAIALLAATALAAAPPPERARVAARLHVLRAAEARSRARAATASTRLADLSTREAELQARLGRNRGELIRLLGALERWRAQPPPALLVSPRRAVDAARGALLMRAITPQLERRARTLAAQAQALQRVRRQAALADADLFAAESDAADRQAATDAVAAHQAALDAVLRPGALAPPLRTAATDAAAPSRLLAPVDGDPAIGWRATWPGRGEAEGLVWRPRPDAPVRAPVTGQVEYAGPLKGSRLVLILKLAGDWRLVLTGLQSVDAAPGAQVAEGAVVGRAPPAGATDADLYLQLRDGARAVDPTSRLSAR